MQIATNRPAISSGSTLSGAFSTGTVADWLLGFGLVLFLGLNGGGFDLTLFGQVGVFAWLLLLLGVLLALLPAGRLHRRSWAAIGLLAALAGWALVGMIWSDSPDKTLAEVARLSTYTAILALALASFGDSSAGQRLGALAAGIVAIAALGLASRYFPDLFSSASDTGKILVSEAPRLNFPLDYWNGLGALMALGIPLLAQAAGGARRLSLRLVATGCLPLVILTLYLTLSRAGMLATAVALLTLFLLNRHLPAFAATAIGLLAGFTLIELARARPDFQNGLTGGEAGSQGLEMLFFSLIVCGVAVAARFFLERAIEKGPFIRGPELSVVQKRSVIGVSLAAVIAVFLLAGGPGKVDSAWESFKTSGTPTNGADRLSTTSGNGRYQLWSSGIRQFKSDPLTGEGAGTFEFWWAEHGDRNGFVRDAHSLFIQTLGESGLIGLTLLLAFFFLVLLTGFRRALDRARPDAAWIAAALAGCLAFTVSVSFDWIWQIPVIVVAFLLLSASILEPSKLDEPTLSEDSPPAEDSPDDFRPEAVAGVRRALQRREQRNLPSRTALAIFALAGVAVAVVPVSSLLLIRQSQSEVAAGRLADSLSSAQAAHRISPSTAAPLIQAAGVFNLAGEYDLAIAEAQKATQAEPVNWRNWFVLSNIESAAGRQRDADESMEKARSLNPRSARFSPQTETTSSQQSKSQ